MRVASAESWFQHTHLEHRQVQQQETLIAGHSAEGERLTAETMVDGVIMARTLERSDSRLSASELAFIATEQGNPLNTNTPVFKSLPTTNPTFPPPPHLVNSDSLHQSHDNTTLSAQLRIMKMMVEIITGRKVTTVSDEQQNNTEPSVKNITPSSETQITATEQSSDNQTFGLRYHYQATYEEYEYSEFSGTAKITLDDGRTISAALNRTQERLFQQQEELVIEVGTAAIDPLIITALDSQLAFTDNKFNFDLNSDGNQEVINTLSQGNYFLALDNNGDGVINTGQELFGPNIGNGFLELQQFDNDNNGFIDSGDEIFKQLRLLNGNGNGQQLFPLDHLKIGAISLEAIATPYTFKTTNNEPIASSRGSSFYITEDGKAGSIQQIDYWI